MHGKDSLENMIPQKGLILKKDWIMTVLRHEYEGGCILTFHFVGSRGGGGGGNSHM